MQRILASAGLIAVLIASGLGAEAYHITGAASYEGYSTYGWAARGTVFPLAQDLSTQACLAVADHSLPMHPVRPSMCALSGASRSLDPNGVVCEQYDVSDLAIPGYALTGVSLPGIGGLCFMSAGTSNWSSCATPGFFNGGRSDGYYPAYAGAGTCAPFPPPVTPSNRHGFLPAPASGSSNLIRITMCPSSSHTLGSPGPLAGGGPVPTCVGPDTTFHARINGVDCVQPPGMVVDYDDVFTYMVADGHVFGAPTTDPPTGRLGTYAVATGVRGTPATQCASGQPWWQSSPPAPPSQEVAVDSCAVYNSEHGDPYPNQQGIVVRPGDGSHQAACAGVASPAQCPLGGIVVNNSPTCIGVPNPDTCDDLSPGPGWAVGAEGECLAAPWVAVYPLYPGCPPAATFGAVVYGPNGAVVLRVCF